MNRTGRYEGLSDQGNGVTRREALRVAGAAGMLAGLLGGHGFGGRGVTAQEASPTHTVDHMADPWEGITREVLVRGIPAEAPDHALVLARVTFAPGATVPRHTHPGAAAIYVVDGAVGYTPMLGSVEVIRGASEGTPGPTETIEQGSEVIVRVGDAIFESERHGDFARNAGSGEETAELLAVYFVAADEPLTTETNELGTPLAGG